MINNILVMPFLKWVGGKRQLIPELLLLLPSKYSSYCEPFVGGGALLFKLQPKVAIINDVNDELMNVYRVIQNDVEKLIIELQSFINTPEYFYEVRDWDRDKTYYSQISDIRKAARIIYLNKTCYNGLFRVNNAGEFNAPFGYYRNPNIIDEPTLRAVNRYLNEAAITLLCEDYQIALSNLKRDSFVYLDPPYDPISSTSNFTGYSKGKFDKNEQLRLKQSCDELTSREIKFMLSNSSTEFIRDLYREYYVRTVIAKRPINSDASKRGDIEEVIITNYEK